MKQMYTILNQCHYASLQSPSHWLFSNYQLNAQFFYFSTICIIHYAPQYVSNSTLLILRKTNCITTASGIVTLSSSRTVCRLRADCYYALSCWFEKVYTMMHGQKNGGWRYQRLWWYNLSSWGWAACCSKHVEEHSVTYILLKNKGIVH